MFQDTKIVPVPSVVHPHTLNLDSDIICGPIWSRIRGHVINFDEKNNQIPGMGNLFGKISLQKSVCFYVGSLQRRKIIN